MLTGCTFFCIDFRNVFNEIKCKIYHGKKIHYYIFMNYLILGQTLSYWNLTKIKSKGKQMKYKSDFDCQAYLKPNIILTLHEQRTIFSLRARMNNLCCYFQGNIRIKYFYVNPKSQIVIIINAYNWTILTEQFHTANYFKEGCVKWNILWKSSWKKEQVRALHPGPGHQFFEPLVIILEINYV